jgi:hypothetical protein
VRNSTMAVQEVTGLEGKMHPVEVEPEKVVGECGSNELEVKTAKAKYLGKRIVQVSLIYMLTNTLSHIAGCDGGRSAIRML